MSADEPRGRDGQLDELAGSVSDGGGIDWARATESAGGQPAARTILALHDVARIAEFSRERQRNPGGDPLTATSAEAAHWAHLVLLEPIGAGASSQVWRAWDPKLQRDVALKFLTASGPGAGTRLLEEARALARIRHPGVVAVHGIAEADGRTGMWMDYLRGPTLADRIEREGPLPPAEVARIGAILAGTLLAVSSAGVVHGDVKPANIVLEADGRVLLADFGLGRRHTWTEDEARRGSGTPVFMAPELLAGGPSTQASDLYALGVTLRWALTGKPPFRAAGIEQLRAEALTGPVPSLRSECPGAPAALVAAIERAMAPRPGDRFPHAGALAAALDERSIGSGGVDAVSTPRRKSLLLPALAAGVGVIVLAALWVVPRMGDHRADPPITTTSPDAVVTTPPRTATAEPTGSYTIEAGLISRNGGSDRRLAAGDRVALGDWLSLEFKSSRPMWVYVLNEDETGETYLLFPQPLFDRLNPLPPDSSVVLPGTIGGRDNAWQVTSRGGREHFLIVASPEPIAAIEMELASLPAARPDRPIRYAAVPDATIERLRGVGGVTALPPATAPGAGSFARFRSLAGREGVASGVWIRTITLENPLK